MKVQMITKNNICESVVVTTTPVEYLVLNKALKQFVNSKDEIPDEDRLIAETMTTIVMEVVELREQGDNT